MSAHDAHATNRQEIAALNGEIDYSMMSDRALIEDTHRRIVRMTDAVNDFLETAEPVVEKVRTQGIMGLMSGMMGGR